MNHNFEIRRGDWVRFVHTDPIRGTHQVIVEVTEVINVNLDYGQRIITSVGETTTQQVLEVRRVSSVAYE